MGATGLTIWLVYDEGSPLGPTVGITTLVVVREGPTGPTPVLLDQGPPVPVGYGGAVPLL